MVDGNERMRTKLSNGSVNKGIKTEIEIELECGIGNIKHFVYFKCCGSILKKIESIVQSRLKKNQIRKRINGIVF